VNEDLTITPSLVIPAADLSWEFSRSGGPGGQSVNTADTRARVRFALARCDRLSPGAKARLAAAHPGWLTSDGDLVLTSDQHRSRWQNVVDVRRRLAAAIADALVRPAYRVATRPTRSSQARRVDEKKKRGGTKSGRGKPRDDE
jgi:ribosome-associated protein